MHYLEQLAESEWNGYVPYDGGEPVFEPDVENMVENVMERYDERILAIFSPMDEDEEED